MHRFRKKSDTKRSFYESSFALSSEDEHIPELPPASHFRTSLILPDLTRRFTLLRTSSGDPVSLEDLKSRFADQRARGAPHLISEAEEDMILQTLGRIRAKNASNNTSSSEREDDPVNLTNNATDRGMESDSTPERTSLLSTSTVYPASSITSSPSSKRYSNNLFASGRFREYNYLRNSHRSGSNRSVASIAPTESTHSLREKPSSNYSESGSLRPTTPEDSGPSSVPSSPNEKTPVARSASLISSSDEAAPQPQSPNLGRLTKTASIALERVFREIEEEAEDEIVMPRTSHPIPRHSPSEIEHPRVVPDSREQMDSGTSNKTHDLPGSPSGFEAGTAISSDKQIMIEPEQNQRLSPVLYGRPGTVSPTPRLPGYIPGMPRPMTPRDSAFDSDDQRSHSTTPRAMSPILPLVNGHTSPLIPSSFGSSLLRRGSDASRSTPRPTSPQVQSSSGPYLSRSGSGRYTPDSNQRGNESASGTDQEGSVVSSAFVRRRPVSPLSGPAFQPLTVPPRPTTPSNITWTVGRPGSAAGHRKQDSSISTTSHHTHSRSGSLSTDSDFQSNTERAKSPSRSMRSPTPLENRSYDQTSSSNSLTWNRPSSPPTASDHRSPSSLSGIDLGSPLTLPNRALRSPTPTQPRSPTLNTNDSSSVVNNTNSRSSKQHSRNNSSAHFSLGLSRPLVFSPIASSSRSSLESTGSSYHSWEAGQKQEITLDIFNAGIENPQPVWHDVDKSSSATPGSSQEDADFEDIIRRYAGLTKSDFVAIQDKLVGVAVAKANNPEVRERTNSLRRRRPSTSQSNYSLNGREHRVASPPPNQNIVTGRRSPAPDHNAKVNALLNSVVDSIHTQSPSGHEITADTNANETPTISPTTRRNRDLARALGFGGDEQPETCSPPVSAEVETLSIPPTSPVEDSALTLAETTDTPQQHESASTTSPYRFPQRSTSLRVPQSLTEQAELVKEVQRKADAATAALMKNSSGQKFHDVNASSVSITRRRISPSQISNPRLVSAPTSVDTVPISPPAASGPINTQTSLNITSRMRRFRNTLRVKPAVVTGEEITPFPIDLQPQSPPTAQPLHRRPTLPLPKALALGSSTDLGKMKSPVASPPASATPGLKGFMARFRKPRTADTHFEHDRNGLVRISPTASSPSSMSHHEQVQSPPVLTTASASPSPPVSYSQPVDSRVDTSPPTTTSASDSAAVKQLFEAAIDLGLDPAAVNDLLSRSKSVSLRNTGLALSRNTSTTAASNSNSRQNSNATERARSPPMTEMSVTPDEAPGSSDDKAFRKMSTRTPEDASQSRSNTPVNSAVVRRTLIFPSEFRASKVDLNQTQRKPSQSGRRHRRSGSAASAQSGRSVHDRAPTPPPPKSTGGRQFSANRTPPVPSLPPTLAAQAEALLHSPPSHGAGEKSNSAYDSLYDMYAGESKHTSAAPDETLPNVSSPAEGAALEVIEMANGETIWSIVNGLRDDDIDSVYINRASFASEYSTRENGEGLQVFVKDHGRSSSKGSNSSFLSRKKSSQGKNRPETKVFYSSPTQIGRLIENLSQGMDAGSFNFGPNLPPDRSTPSSFHSDADMHWTVEERLEHMLGSMRNP
ncbi:hypothetical protein BJ138DRAFT_1173017 [Hygrophoropsis aurantiaca]|uniref:Uncharacterized protein n=1 Tax=Hygrophoropsis aurantiaca TaxID=72124 RepID=A0ACB8AC13_9AGAM|nr:hypothetical protein BJ138DRAFT_1173017 [Hygrophoropsis aurantiaca]